MVYHQMKEITRRKLWDIAIHRDLHHPHILNLPSFGKQITISDLFPFEPQEVVLELGSGWGEVAIELAKKSPSTAYILIEKLTGRIQSTLKKCDIYSLENIKLLPVNFHWFLDVIFPNQSFDQVILNFPDPWPKSKHHKHRTLNSHFLEILRKILKSGGKFQFATDHGPYARNSIRLFRDAGNDFSFKEEWTHNRDDFPKSVFEQEMKGLGKRIYYLERRFFPTGK
jgi:tRNA (guanine-N7-)-methyltransferase